MSQNSKHDLGQVSKMSIELPPSFCGLAALALMGRARLCDTDRLLRWAANRQMRQEGGFQVGSGGYLQASA